MLQDRYGGDAEPTENSVYVAGDGSVRWASVETYQQGDYTEDELKTRPDRKSLILTADWERLLPMRMRKALRNFRWPLFQPAWGTEQPHWLRNTTLRAASLNLPRRLGIIMCHSPSWIQAGWLPCPVNLRISSFQDEKGKAVDQETALKDGQNMVVKATGQGVIVTEKKSSCKRWLRPEGFQPGADVRRGNQLHHIKVILII